MNSLAFEGVCTETSRAEVSCSDASRRRRTRLLTGWLLVILAALRCAGGAGAEEPSEAKPPEPPQVLMCVPLGGVPGQSTAIKARGLHLEGTTEVKSNTAGVAVKLLSQSKAAVPANLSATSAGDTQVEFELTLSGDLTAEIAELVFVAPHGQATYQLPSGAVGRTLAEVEPNAGFKQPQAIEVPQLVLGQIERPHDVDVYAVDLVQGQSIRVEVAAQEHGSALDALLTFADAEGTTLLSNDDHAGSRDARIETTIAAAGRYFVIVQDANDVGGEAHPYRLSLTEAQPPVSFANQVAPILQQHCVGCHGPSTAEGGYRLDSYQQLVQAGDSGAKGFVGHDLAHSESFRRITTDEEGQRMPLDAPALSQEQIGLIRTWLEQGAKFDGANPDEPLVGLIPPPAHPDAPARYAASLPVGAIAFSPQGDALLVGGYYEVTLWHPGDGKLLRRIGQVAQRTYGIAWHPSGAQFAVACGNPGQLGEVRLFSASGELQKVLARSDDVIHDVAFNPAGDALAVALSDGSIRVYDTAQWKLRLEIASHLDWVLAVAWSPDGSRLASGSRDKTAKVFDAQTGQLLASYGRHEAAVRGVLFHPSGEEVYSSGANQRWDRWKISGAERVRDMHLGAEAFKLLGIGDYFLVASANNRVHLMKAQESDRIRELHGSGESRLISVAAHEQTDRVAAGSQGGEVTLWQLSTGNQISHFRAVPAAQDN